MRLSCPSTILCIVCTRPASCNALSISRQPLSSQPSTGSVLSRSCAGPHLRAVLSYPVSYTPSSHAIDIVSFRLHVHELEGLVLPIPVLIALSTRDRTVHAKVQVIRNTGQPGALRQFCNK
jgi:hypothetical protein